MTEKEVADVQNELAEMADGLGKEQRLFLLWYMMDDYISLLDECINEDKVYDDSEQRAWNMLARVSAIEQRKFAHDAKEVLCAELW